MARTSDKRERLMRSADRLILQQGFRQTTLSDIARDSGVPLGNVYYYFRTKDDIGHTVVQNRIREFEGYLQQLDRLDDPRARLLAFLDYPVEHRIDLSEHGCPMGTLAYELSRVSGLEDEASRLLRVEMDWAERQFRELGAEKPDDLALQFVSNLQGMSLLANALGSPLVIDRMVARTREWIGAL